MKKKYWRRFLVCLLTVSMVFTWTAAPRAAEKSVGKISGLNTVYVTSSSQLASGDGSSKDKPLHDIKKAFDAAADGGVIVIVDFYVDSNTNEKGMTTPSDKKLTIRGENNNVSLTLRYGVILENDLKFDGIKLETTSTDPQGRCFYANGYSLTMTDSVQCFVNNNWNQKAYIYAGSPDGSVITGRRAKIDVGGGNFAGIYGYGKDGAKVKEGSDITLRAYAQSDKLNTASVLNIYSNQTLTGSVENIGHLNIASPLQTVDLINVEDVTLNSSLTLTTLNEISISGDLDLEDYANLNIQSNLHVKGSLNGSGTISSSFRGQVISDVSDSNGELTFYKPEIPWEIRTEVTGSYKRWYAQPKNEQSVYYINGTDGNDGNSGDSPGQAFATVTKALEVASSGKKNISFIITGDTTVTEPLTLSIPGASFEISGIGVAPAKLTFEKPITMTNTTDIRNIRMDFSACADEDAIIADSAYITFDYNISMEGAPPDIKYQSNANGSGQQLEIFSGTFGSIRDVNKEAMLTLYNGKIQGKVEGWSYIEAAHDPYDENEIIVGGIEGADFLSVSVSKGSFIVNGDIQVSDLSTEGSAANLKITSGKKITADSYDNNISITVLPNNDHIGTGTYLAADSLSGGDGVTRIELLDTPGYLLLIEKVGAKYIGSLKTAEQLTAPGNITWDEQEKGKVTWDQVPNASKYLLELYQGQRNLASAATDTTSYDFAGDIRGSKGGYRVSIRAVDETNQYADSNETFSGIFHIYPKVKSISLDPNEMKIDIGDIVKIKASVSPYDAKQDIVWSSSEKSVAEVDKNGSVKAVSEGTVVITAAADDDSGVSSSCKVVVNKPVQKVQEIQLNQTEKNIFVGDSFTLQASVQPQTATDKSLSWSSSNGRVVSVTSTGKITAIAEGKAFVTAASRDGSGIKSSCTVTVKKKAYSINYVMNGGRNNQSNPSGFTDTPVRLKAPERSGYLFSGWYTDAGFHNKIDTISQKKDYRLYAKWQKISLKAPKVQTLKKTVKTNLSVSYSRVSGAEGYEVSVSTDSSFRSSAAKKWITTAAQKTAGGLKSNAQYYTRIRAYRVDSARKKVYGPYSAKTKGYSIKYRLNKGKNSSQNLVSYYNTSVRLKNPSRKGYRFKGWYTSKKYKKRIKSISKGKRINYTLYAKWKKK